ncbi:expansin-A23-like [Rutidosis leptorrhynchoides]|uniref:expansin-A23-like n=1 Tax=Rutidosis leptorrhynchoides TaxID=125765 RepID=UPI003A9A324F
MANISGNLMGFLTLLGFLSIAIEGRIDHGWYDAHATFYGDISGGETMMGACGYGDLFQQGYGLETAALSTPLFDYGLSCGACFEIKCKDSKWCKPNVESIKITGTNFCPPRYPATFDAWCNPPQKHFDLSLKMFLAIAEYRAGIVPVQYRRILCSKQGGVKFQISGMQYWFVVLPFNVAGSGNVALVKIKGSNTNWITMTRNWGQNWQTGENLSGQSLSFQVTTGDGRTKRFYNIVPANWGFGYTYEGQGNF